MLICIYYVILQLAVIRQNGESQNGDIKKAKHATFSQKTNISYPLIRTRGIRNVWFLGILRALLFCYLRSEIRSFALLPTNLS